MCTHERHIDVVAMLKLLLNHCPDESNETGQHMKNSLYIYLQLVNVVHFFSYMYI